MPYTLPDEPPPVGSMVVGKIATIKILRSIMYKRPVQEFEPILDTWLDVPSAIIPLSSYKDAVDQLYAMGYCIVKVPEV